ncbi:MAG: divalent-cation tolerance protein CutA [Pseudomonadota bacterium]
MGEANACLIWCPFPDNETARKVAGQLLEDRLVACANILGAVESVFVWEGEVQSETECGVLFKTDEAHMDKAIAVIGSLHPYETPAILGWNCEKAFPATLHWLGSSLRNGT